MGSGWSRHNGKSDAQLRQAGETLINIAGNIPPCALSGRSISKWHNWRLRCHLAKDSRWLAECALHLKRQVLPSARTPNWLEHLRHFMLPQDACDTPSMVMKLFKTFVEPNKGPINRNAVTMTQSQ